jgi:predicted CopG family antitoxin
MEQNKLEKEFRKKLNQREITPTENAWDRLDAMLTVAEQKKPKRNYGWIYMAASIIGFAFLGTFFLNQSNQNTTIESNEVVIKNNQKAEPIQKDILKVPSISKAESTVVISEVKEAKENARDTNAIIKNQVAENSPSDNLIPILEKKEINQEIIQIAAANTSDLNVDKILAAVQTISKEGNSKTKIKVNPNMLLTQVDGELELSFREKVINKVNKNYQTVKVALANRNNQ